MAGPEAQELMGDQSQACEQQGLQGLVLGLRAPVHSMHVRQLITRI